MKDTKQKQIFLSFDEELFIEGKKMLFKKNLTPQQVMTYIFHQITLENKEVVQLLDKASEHYNTSKNVTGEDRKKVRILNRDILYDIIERSKGS